jgi:hypothetical protein
VLLGAAHVPTCLNYGLIAHARDAFDGQRRIVTDLERELDARISGEDRRRRAA